MDEPIVQPLSDDFNIKNPQVLQFDQITKFITQKPLILENYLNSLPLHDLNNLLTEISQHPDIIKKYLNRKSPYYFKTFTQQMASLFQNNEKVIYMDKLELGSRTIKPIIVWAMTLFSAVIAFITGTLMALMIGLGVSLGIALVAGIIELYIVKRKEREFFNLRHLGALHLEILQKLNQKKHDLILEKLATLLKVPLNRIKQRKGKTRNADHLNSLIKRKLITDNLLIEEIRINIEKKINHLTQILEKFSDEDLKKVHVLTSLETHPTSSYVEKTPLKFKEFLEEEVADKVIRNSFLNEGLLRAAGTFTLAGFILTIANALGFMGTVSFLSGPIGLAVLASIAVFVFVTVGFITLYSNFKDAQRAHENKLMGAEIRFLYSLSSSLDDAMKCIDDIEKLSEKAAVISASHAIKPLLTTPVPSVLLFPQHQGNLEEEKITLPGQNNHPTNT